MGEASAPIRRRVRDGGIHVAVQLAGLFATNRVPESITSHSGQRWLVKTVLDHWESEEYQRHGWARPVGSVCVTWNLEVTGPLPGAGGVGRQLVQLRGYGDGAGWWLAPLAPQPGGCATRAR